MKTIKTLGYASISGMALALLTPSLSFAEMSEPGASGQSSSLVHRVSHSLAGSETYTSSGPSGYKWGRKAEEAERKSTWAADSTPRSGYKWGEPSVTKPEAQTFASTSSYEWGVRNFAEQAGYRWGLNSFAEQTGYRWGLNNFAEQTGYRWGLNSFAEQTGYRWGLNR